jgi:DNA invertase Pin-like site-specific DNA recombinase
MATTEPAGAYYRMSNDEQDTSIEQQREEVERYAQRHGYRIIREYIDEGISGDATEKRKGFQRMTADAKKLGDFKVILCWNQDRFGRFDTLEAGYWIKPLRDAGVRLETVVQGKLPWDDFAGRIVYAVQQEGKHAFLRDLSRNTLRGKLRNAKKAYFNGGTVPFGFDRLLLNDKDQPVRRLARGERTDKPRGWHTALIPVEDEAELEIVRWIFRTFADRDISVRALTEELNSRAIPGPGSAERGRLTKWGRQTLLDTLAKPVYIGHSVFGRSGQGKFCRAVDGEAQEIARVQKTEAGNPKKQINADGFVVNEDAHDGIIDRDLWDRVQAKLKTRRQERYFPRGAGYPLTGLVVCGHCGKKMHGATGRYNLRGGRKAYRRYVCSSYTVNGPSACGFHAILEEKLLPFLVRKLQEDYLAPDKLAAMEAEIERQLGAGVDSGARNVKGLQAKLAQLDTDIRQGAKNLLRAGDNADVLGEALTELRQERERVAREIEEQERSDVNPEKIKQTVADAVDALRQLHDLLGSADLGQLREVFRQMLVGIELFFEAIPKKKRTYHRLVRGVARLRPQANLSDIRLCPVSDRKTSSMRRIPRCHK